MTTSINPQPLTRIEVPANTDMSMFNDRTNTIFIIKYPCKLNNQLELGPNCVLDFQGGYIASPNKNGKIAGLNTLIKADNYRIFYDIQFGGTFSNSAFKAEWFGAIGCNKNTPYGVTTDSTSAIQYALDSTGELDYPVPIELECSLYHISNSIVMSKKRQTLRCRGRMQLCIMNNSIEEYIPVIIMQEANQTIDIEEIHYRDYDYKIWDSTYGTAVLLSGNVYNANINIERIIGLRIGFDLTPPLPKTLQQNHIFGIQYCKIRWQYCETQTGINIKIHNHNVTFDNDDKQCLWVNENQFFGGRLKSEYGIVIDGHPSDINLVNGNVFNCIGLEGERLTDGDLLMKIPIKISNARLNEFHDLRISESVVQTTVKDEEGNPISFESTYIDLKNCEFMNFSIKSLVSFNFIKAENCRSITINGAITDIGMGSLSKGRTKIVIDKSYPVTAFQNDKKSYQFSLSELVPQNYCKYMSFDSNRLISFDELFVKDSSGQLIMSNTCRIYRFNSENMEQNRLAIYFENSCYKIHPEMIIYFRGEGTGDKSIEFRNTMLSSPISTITKYGTYKITFDRDDNIFVIPLAYFE